METFDPTFVRPVDDEMFVQLMASPIEKTIVYMLYNSHFSDIHPKRMKLDIYGKRFEIFDGEKLMTPENPEQISITMKAHVLEYLIAKYTQLPEAVQRANVAFLRGVQKYAHKFESELNRV